MVAAIITHVSPNGRARSATSLARNAMYPKNLQFGELRGHRTSMASFSLRRTE